MLAWKFGALPNAGLTCVESFVDAPKVRVLSGCDSAKCGTYGGHGFEECSF